MFLFGTHRSIAQRLRLTLDRRLGAGNFFWYACAIADQLNRPVFYHAPAGSPEAELAAYSLADLRARVVAYADWYSDHGVVAGDRIGVYLDDGLQVLLHHIALTSIGAANVLANPRMAPDVAAHYFRRTQVSALVADDSRLSAGRDAGLSEPAVWPARQFGDLAPARTTRPRRRHRHRPGDLILISHSSGTTGVPKPTTFTHGGFFIGKRERLWKFPSRRTDRLLSALPYSHSAGLSYVSLALMLGLPTLLTDDTSGPGVVAAMRRFRPTIVVAFPISLAEIAVDDAVRAAARDVHTWMGMGDASHERHIRPLLRLGRRGSVPGSAYVDGLGSSEMGMVLFKVTYTPETARFGRRIGRPVPVVRRAVVLDEDGRVLPDGQAGLLGVRTPSVTPGYWADPELDEHSRRAGYFLTGDIVRRDRDGTFYHLDRTPDVIRTVDGPVYSLPVEEALLNATEAVDAAVIGVDDPDHPGHAGPIAVLLFRDGAPRSAAGLLAAGNAALTRAGLPHVRALVVAEGRADLPVGVTGKVLKRVLRERHRDLLRSAATSGVVALSSG